MTLTIENSPTHVKNALSTIIGQIEERMANDPEYAAWVMDTLTKQNG